MHESICSRYKQPCSTGYSSLILKLGYVEVDTKPHNIASNIKVFLALNQPPGPIEHQMKSQVPRSAGLCNGSPFRKDEILLSEETLLKFCCRKANLPQRLGALMGGRELALKEVSMRLRVSPLKGFHETYISLRRRHDQCNRV